MSVLDWVVLSFTMTTIIGYGIWKTKGSKDIQGFLLGGNEAKWWTVGLSVMATQASAITFLSTPGQAYHDGMEFLQFYFMLPVALIIICITFIPLYMLGVNPFTVASIGLFTKWHTRIYHANIKSNYGFLRYVFVTPQSHRIHHYLLPQHRDQNFGVIFCMWDRIFIV